MEQARRYMIEHTLIRRGIKDLQVLQAMNHVPREEFLPEDLKLRAYEDNPLPIGNNQTVSQPYIVALMAEALALNKNSRVLEIGTGCGYSAAILGQISKEVYSVERIKDLAMQASEKLYSLGHNNVQVFEGDGTLGLADYGPYDAISVTACGPGIPQSLVDQLNEGGRIVIPVENNKNEQNLILGEKTKGGLTTRDLGGVRFVPLMGKQGWSV